MEPYAAGLAVLSPEEVELGVAVLDIGAQATEMHSLGGTFYAELYFELLLHSRFDAGAFPVPITPFTPSMMISREPLMSVTMEGNPIAPASMTTLGNPSR